MASWRADEAPKLGEPTAGSTARQDAASIGGVPHEQAAYTRFDDLADQTARLVIKSYSSSFGLATRLLDAPTRRHVRNIYALVRVADEVVDAPRPQQTVRDRCATLDELERETLAALQSASSSNLVVHAFARTATAIGIDADLIGPFFTSMRTDLDRRTHDAVSFEAYVYGSAEVVGLMCLRAFLAAAPQRQAEYDRLNPAARRLGAAFQKVNFVRDIGADARELGRSYFPGVTARTWSDPELRRWLDDIDGDLAVAAEALPALPRPSRVAVCAALDLFGELVVRLRATSADQVANQRIRVPNHVKLRLVGRAWASGGHPRHRRHDRPVPHVPRQVGRR